MKITDFTQHPEVFHLIDELRAEGIHQKEYSDVIDEYAFDLLIESHRPTLKRPTRGGPSSVTILTRNKSPKKLFVAKHQSHAL